MSTTAVMTNEESFYCTSFDPLETIQPTPKSYFRLATGMEAIVPCDSGMSSDSCPEPGPYLQITVKPSDRFRFRYRSESGSHGKLRGAAKGRAKTNFPTVKLHNYDSSSKIEIHASLYTNEEIPRPHILELVGKNCSRGICTEILSDDNTAVFRYLEIESKKKEELITILSQNKIDLYGEGYDEEEIRKEALNEIKALNMNVARLCFEAFHNSRPVCPKVFSDPITNLKSASSDLKITRLSLVAGRCSGGEEMILLCDKINREDIKIRFYEKDENDALVWEEYGDFNKCDVHHQVAIAFRTPRYYQNIEKTVCIELYRPSDSQSGEALKFIYIPDEIDALRFSKKRKFNSTEFTMQLQDAMQASSSSQFTSSPSNVSSGTEDDIYFQGSPGASSSNEHTFDPNLPGDLFDIDPLLQNFFENLVDRNNFGEQLLTPYLEDISTATDQDPTFQAGDEFDPTCEMDSATQLSGTMINYIKEAQSYAAGPQMALSDINDKKSEKLSFSRPVGEMAGPVQMINLQVDSGDRKNLEGLEKNSKNFEHFKKGIDKILRNRREDAYMRYIASLMSVEDENGNLLLHLAVEELSENINLIAKILDIAPQNVNKQNKFQETCLHFATMNDNWKLVFLLLTRKGNPSIKNQNGDNCFHLAAKSNLVNTMKVLLSSNLKHGRQIPSLDDLNYDGLSPLHLCIMNNAKECMQLLLRAGANVNITERKTGRSPLHLAIEQQSSLVGYLLSHSNIDTDCTDYRGYTPYEAACEARGSSVIHEELLKVAQLSKGNEGPTIISFLRTENMKPQKLAAETDVYDSSSETSSESDSEDVDYPPTTDINHQEPVDSIQHHNTNCIQENLNTIDEGKLCQILDANSGWRKIGKCIGYDERSLNDLKMLSKQSSPTKIILMKVKRSYPDYDEKTLKNILEMADLKETVLMLENLNI